MAEANPSRCTLYLASDVHAELDVKDRAIVDWGRHPECDIVLAGDIGRISDRNGTWAATITEVSSRYRHVFIVLGNHELWHSHKTREALVREARAFVATLPNATLLDRDVAHTLEGVRIAGCTLWSPATDDTRHRVNDFRHIHKVEVTGRGPRYCCITPADMRLWYEWDSTWLASTLDADTEPRCDVVVTHHAPLPCMNPPAYADSPLTSAFVADMTGDVDWRKVPLWLSGHTHGRMERSYEGCRLVAHCAGYGHEFSGVYTPLAIDVELVSTL